MMTSLKGQPLVPSPRPAADAGRENGLAGPRGAPHSKEQAGQAFAALVSREEAGRDPDASPRLVATGGQFAPVLRDGPHPVRADLVKPADAGDGEESARTGDAPPDDRAMPWIAAQLRASVVLPDASRAAPVAIPPAAGLVAPQAAVPAALRVPPLKMSAGGQTGSEAALAGPLASPSPGSQIAGARAPVTAKAVPETGGKAVPAPVVRDQPSRPGTMAMSLAAEPAGAAGTAGQAEQPAARGPLPDAAPMRGDEPRQPAAKPAQGPAPATAIQAPVTGAVPPMAAAIDTRSLATSIGEAVSGMDQAATTRARLPEGTSLGHTTLHTMRIQLKPEHLGHVGVTLRMGQEGLVVEIRAETQEGRRLLELDADSVTDWLRHQGCTVAELRVTGAHQAQAAPGALQGGGQDRTFSQDFAAGGQPEARDGRDGTPARQDGRGTGQQGHAPEAPDQAGGAPGVIYV